jgi:hypothetical protein
MQHRDLMIRADQGRHPPRQIHVPTKVGAHQKQV